jgi:hypothetical protein
VTPSRPGVTRRQLLTGGAAASLAAVLAGQPDGPSQLLMALARDVGGVPILKESPKTFTFQVEREADLVLLDITFYGFLLNSGGGQVTSLAPGGSDNVIVVQFPPQAIGEAAYTYIEEPEWYVDPPPVLSAVSGPSRLCFTLNTGQQVDFPTMTPADLLDWSSWTLLVPEVAQVDEAELDRIDAGSSSRGPARGSKARPATATPPKPSEMLTAIEYPYALFLAPTVYTGGPFFGFSTTFAGRREPLFGEHEGEGGAYGTPRLTGISDCWTAALQVSYYDKLEFDRQFEYGAVVRGASRADRPQIELGGGGGLRGVEAYSPPPQRKPEVAAIWTRDYESEPGGVTPQTAIDYEPFEIQIRRAAAARAARSRGAKAKRAITAGRAGQLAARGAVGAPTDDPAQGAAGAKAGAKVRAKAKAKAKVRRQVRRGRTRHDDRRRR